MSIDAIIEELSTRGAHQLISGMHFEPPIQIG
jgi:hypothetical protein